MHDLTHLHFLVSGCLFWWLVVGRDPSRWRLSYPAKLGILAVGIPVTAILGVSLTGAHVSIAPLFHTVADTQRGGSILWIVGEITTFVAMAIIVYQWMRFEEREAVRADRLLDAQTQDGASTDGVAVAVGGGVGRPRDVPDTAGSRAPSPSTSPPTGPETLEPLLVMHGFPSSSFDFHHVVDALAEHRRVLLFDMIGYGLSAKPDRAYTIDLQADVAQAFVADAGVSTLALLTHDVGDTVGGELLARQDEGRWPVEITRRVVTNGSIYIEMAHLSAGPAAPAGPPRRAAARRPPASTVPPCRPAWPRRSRRGRGGGRGRSGGGVGAHLARRRPPPVAPDHPLHRGAATEPGPFHRSDRVAPVAAGDRVGHRRPHRGGAHGHPAPRARPDARLTWLDDVGHYPMIESPSRLPRRRHPALA